MVSNLCAAFPQDHYVTSPNGCSGQPYLQPSPLNPRNATGRTGSPLISCSSTAMFLATRLSVKTLLVVVAVCAFIFSVSQLHQPKRVWEILPEKVSEDKASLREDKESPCPVLPPASVPVVKKQPWEDPTSVLIGPPTKAFRSTSTLRTSRAHL